MRSRIRATIGVVTCGLLAASLTATAHADPSVRPAATDIVGIGSTSTQDLFTQLAKDYDAQSPAPSRTLYSFDSDGTSVITTKAGCTPISRTTTSDASLLYLRYNTRPSGDRANFCVDFVRSARGPQSSDLGLAFVRYAQEATTWSATSTSSAPTNAPASLSNTELKAIYTCDAGLVGGSDNTPVRWNQVGGTSTDAVLPVLPQAASETRSFFLRAIGVTNVGSCVSQPSGLADNQRSTPTTLFGGANAKNLVIPYSVSTYLAQSQNGHDIGRQGNQVLGSGRSGSTVVAPTVGNPGTRTINPQLVVLGLTDFVYNAVRDPGTSTSGVPTYLQPLLGNGDDTGYLCTDSAAQADIKSYGFRVLGTHCGTVIRP